jgi:hypothetical protein
MDGLGRMKEKERRADGGRENEWWEAGARVCRVWFKVSVGERARVGGFTSFALSLAMRSMADSMPSRARSMTADAAASSLVRDGGSALVMGGSALQGRLNTVDDIGDMETG